MMKNIGVLVKNHGIKPVINLLYLLPVFLLVVGIVMIAISMFKVPATEHMYYYIGMLVLLVLIIILLAARSANMPKYVFEMYENGIKVIYKKEKTPNEEYSFDEISEIWNIASNGGKKANFLAFKANGNDTYKLISFKYSDQKGLMQTLSKKVTEINVPIKSAALVQGERLVFPMLPTDGEQVMTSEKAILAYLQQTKKEHLSLDRFSLFDGQKTFALADISGIKFDEASANVIVNSIAGNALYTQSYFAIGNADIFLELIKILAAPKIDVPNEGA